MPQAGLVAPAPARFSWDRTFLVLTAVLSSTILLKVAQVQYLELLYLLQVGLLLFAFGRQGFRATLRRQMLWLGGLWALFLAGGLVLAAVVSTQDFFPPPEVSALHQPVLITILRATELFLSVFALLYLVHVFAQSADRLRLTLRVYFWTGVASALYALLSLPLQLLADVNLGTYSTTYRWRGFYNEGGPYGLYIISVFLVALALRALAWERRRRLSVASVLLAAALLGSQSKAAIGAFLALVAINVLLLQSGRRRVAVLVALAMSVAFISSSASLQASLRVYQKGVTAYERLSRLHRHDANLVQGRIAGAFLVPRMIAQHPLVGVGWGNYGLVRDAPEYRGSAAFTDIADEPGLGIFGQAAELGLPLTSLLVLVLFLPVLYLRHLRAPSFLVNLALLQPIVHLFGAQLNLTYPWVVTALALGLGYSHRRDPLTTPPTAPTVRVQTPQLAFGTQ